MSNSIRKSLRPLSNAARPLSNAARPLTNMLSSKRSSRPASAAAASAPAASAMSSFSSTSFFSRMCLPSKLYLLLVIIVQILIMTYIGFQGVGNFTKYVISNAIWTYGLDNLCNNGWNKMAWALTLFTVFGMIIYILSFVSFDEGAGPGAGPGAGADKSAKDEN